MRRTGGPRPGCRMPRSAARARRLQCYIPRRKCGTPFEGGMRVCASMRRPLNVKANSTTVADLGLLEFGFPFDRQASIRTRLNPVGWIRCRVVSVTFRRCNLHDGLEPALSTERSVGTKRRRAVTGTGLRDNRKQTSQPQWVLLIYLKPVVGPGVAVESAFGFPSSSWKSAQRWLFHQLRQLPQGVFPLVGYAETAQLACCRWA